MNKTLFFQTQLVHCSCNRTDPQFVNVYIFEHISDKIVLLFEVKVNFIL